MTSTSPFPPLFSIDLRELNSAVLLPSEERQTSRLRLVSEGERRSRTWRSPVKSRTEIEDGDSSSDA
jgi:hypothetical protein